jgi:hypothetical protein
MTHRNFVAESDSSCCNITNAAAAAAAGNSCMQPCDAQGKQALYRLTTYSITPTADGLQKSLLGCAKAAGSKSHLNAMFFPLKWWASYLLLCIALQQPAACASQWETVHETSSNVWGGRRTPPVR